jgi:hypothetical protein
LIVGVELEGMHAPAALLLPDQEFLTSHSSPPITGRLDHRLQLLAEQLAEIDSTLQPIVFELLVRVNRDQGLPPNQIGAEIGVGTTPSKTTKRHEHPTFQSPAVATGKTDASLATMVHAFGRGAA